MTTPNRLLPKLRLVYLPFLLTAAGFVVLYTLLHWLVVIETGLAFSVPEFLVQFALPLALPFCIVLIVLRPRFKLFDFEKEETSFLYLMVAALAIAVPTIVAQIYLAAATGELTSLESIKRIDELPLTRYYSIVHSHIAWDAPGVHPALSVEGKRSEDLRFDLHIVVPILDDPSDTLDSTTAAWLGVEYSRMVSNRSSDEEKQREWEDFLHDSFGEFDSLDLQDFVYLERVGNNSDHDAYMAAIDSSERYRSPATAPVLLPVYTPFEARARKEFLWMFGSFGIGALVMFLFVAFPSLGEDAIEQPERAIESGIGMIRRDLGEIGEFILPRRRYLVTPLLLDTNIALFIVMVCAGLGFISFQGNDLLAWGASYGPAIREGDWWRLLTSMFLHGGAMHLASNMIALLLVGGYLEELLGSWRVLLIYFLSGIGGGLASLWFNDAVVGVGASGAIFGLYGTILSLLLARAVPPRFGAGFLVGMVIFAGLNIAIGFVPGSGIDNAAHVGGLVCGLIIGVAILSSMKKDPEDEKEAAALKARVDERIREWDITVEGWSPTASSILAVGRRGDLPVVLKVVRGPGDEWKSGRVLEAFDGRGMVKAYEYIDGAVLMERLSPGNSLVRLSVDGRDDEAIDILADVIDLTSHGTGSLEEFTTVEEWGRGFSWYLGSGDSQIPRDLVEQAEEIYRELCGTQRSRRLLHGDLHHDNVLLDETLGWVAIDPKGVVGEGEYEIGASLRNPPMRPELFSSPRRVEKRVRRFVQRLDLDHERVVRWAFAQAVLSAIWSVEDGFTVDRRDPSMILAGVMRSMVE